MKQKNKTAFNILNLLHLEKKYKKTEKYIISYGKIKIINNIIYTFFK